MKQCEFCHRNDEHTDDCPNHPDASAFATIPFTLHAPLVLDVETLPLVASMSEIYDPTKFNPPANYKTSEAILGWHERNEKDWAAKREKECSVNPRLGRILCFGSSNGIVYATTEAEEAAMLVSAWEQILDAHGRVVTWNGGFDLRFLVIRSLALGVAPSIDAATIRSWFKKYSVFEHFDVKAILMNWDVKASGEGLDEWSKFFGLPGKPEGVDGGSVAWLHAEEQHETIKQYCLSDVANTAAMYQRLIPFFGGSR